MSMTNEELKRFYFGAYRFEETEDGWLQAFQYSKEQTEYFKGAFDFWYDRCMASTAKTIEFVTEGTKVSFDYKLIWLGSPDSFELAVDGQITKITYVTDLLKADGPQGESVPKEGKIEWELPEGKKSVVIYLPADATILVRNFEVNAAVERPKKGEKVLWLGDSITQGYGPLRSSMTYVSVANRALNYDVINQGIGGYVYDKKSLMRMDGYQPDKIIVALGTNQFWVETMKDVEEYYETLIWTAGVRGEPMPGLPQECVGHGNRVLVDEYNRVKGLDGSVFAVGDICLMQRDGHPKGDPQMAQPALQMANNLAKNLNRGEFRTPFRYRDRGSMATIGKAKAVADLPHFSFNGFFAWLVWMFIHLMSILGMRNKLSVLTNWTWNYLFYSTSLRLLLRPTKYPLRKHWGE